ncbi:MAG: hypothetical protein AAGB93_13955 [Planctomycetota bacterium]
MIRTKSERVTTLHPRGKQGVNIERTKYRELRRALLRAIPTRGEGVRFLDLVDLVEPHLDPSVFGPDVSRPWYVTTVKQDLEARGMVMQVPSARPQRLLKTDPAAPETTRTQS